MDLKCPLMARSKGIRDFLMVILNLIVFDPDGVMLVACDSSLKSLDFMVKSIYWTCANLELGVLILFIWVAMCLVILTTINKVDVLQPKPNSFSNRVINVIIQLEVKRVHRNLELLAWVQFKDGGSETQGNFFRHVSWRVN